jgi:hypothetical protein
MLSLLSSISYAMASGSTEVEGLGCMTSFFIVFGVLIVLNQFVPGLMLIGGLLRGLFSPIDEKATDANNK